ncbi:MAG: hypothetical protein KJ798_12525 [Gammaproteobacteria bacterium]|nr:hypothetical protein [Gammaproteobacteria bacterium]MBU0849882.1 hypothetical protein [Gammaproteobacteria bacterium]MBU1266245.1 hypothetical protein [Gammaproteobacteria bacterium]MBU1527565.1 hypothetical protein [Gammaproteobacteria bacterium]MBU1781194.1 hypothetical protein [Gammaproteobacteria bacterium]
MNKNRNAIAVCVESMGSSLDTLQANRIADTGTLNKILSLSMKKTRVLDVA